MSQRKADKLQPVFQYQIMALQGWKTADDNQDSKELLSRQIEKLKKSELPLLQAFEKLGQFLFESVGGTPEAKWWIGDFTALQMGRAIYEEHIKKIEPIDEYIEQLATQLRLAA